MTKQQEINKNSVILGQYNSGHVSKTVTLQFINNTKCLEFYCTGLTLSVI